MSVVLVSKPSVFGTSREGKTRRTLQTNEIRSRENDEHFYQHEDEQFTGSNGNIQKTAASFE